MTFNEMNDVLMLVNNRLGIRPAW